MRTLAVSTVMTLAGVALAVTPATWEHSTEANFTKGEFDGTVVSSLGEIRLARRTEVLAASEAAPPVVSALAVAGETIYVGSGTEGAVYRIDPGTDDR